MIYFPKSEHIPGNPLVGNTSSGDLQLKENIGALSLGINLYKIGVTNDTAP